MKSTNHLLCSISSIVMIALLSSCKNETAKQNPTSTKDTVATANPSEFEEAAVLWYQVSPEQRAGYAQAYGVASDYLKKHKEANKKSKSKFCVVLDLDETVFDNSPYQAYLIENSLSHDDTIWSKWVNSGTAKALPGVQRYVTQAKENGYEVFYISNRKDNLQEATMKNLRDLNLPFVDSMHVMLKAPSDTINKHSTKRYRRNKIREVYKQEIVQLIGDQLADLHEAFEYSPTNYNADDSIAKYLPNFGKSFIVLPNPMYGDWYNVLVLENIRPKDDAQAEQLRKKSFIPFKP